MKNKIKVSEVGEETQVSVNGLVLIRYKKHVDGSITKTTPFVNEMEVEPMTRVSDLSTESFNTLKLWINGLERPTFAWNKTGETRYSYVCKSNGVQVAIADIYVMGSVFAGSGRIWHVLSYGNTSEEFDDYDSARERAERLSDTWVLGVVGRVSMRTEDLPDYIIKELEATLYTNEIEDDPYPHGYHIKDIEKGVLGEASKIREETEEFLDALDQESSVMALVELSDLIGAIHAYLRKHHPSIKIDDLIKMSDITARAFISGHRT